MKQRYIKFVTEQGQDIEIDESIELTDHLTAEIYPAAKATPEQAVIIPARWANQPRSQLALRCDTCYAAQRRRERRGVA